MRLDRIKRIMPCQLYLTILSLTILSFIVGCGDGGGGNSSSPASSGSSNIEVDKTSLTFGDTVLDHSSDQTISIQNTGSSNLIIGQIALSNQISAPFSISANNCSGTQIAPSQTCTLIVRFSPTLQGPFQDTFDIPSNDPVKNPVTVSVSGYGRGLNVAINRINTDSCPNVSLLVTITDRNSDAVGGLTKDSFSLFENGVAKTIGSVSPANLAVSASLVLDYSGSMHVSNSIPDLEAAAKGFIDQLNVAIGDEAEIIKYDQDIFRMQDFTTDHTVLKAAIEAPFPGKNLGTRLYDTVSFAADDLSARSNVRAIIAMSDGVDDLSSISLTDVIAHCNDKGVNVYTIGLGDVTPEPMQQLASQTGGQYFFAPTSSQLRDIYLKISAILAGQYLIEFDSSSSGAGRIDLKVEAVVNGLQGEASTQFTGCP